MPRACVSGGTLLGFRSYHRELDRERVQARLHLLPLLLAEHDLEQLNKIEKSRELEKRVMEKSDKPWKEESIYNNPHHRYIAPNYLLSLVK